MIMPDHLIFLNVSDCDELLGNSSAMRSSWLQPNAGKSVPVARA
jgi:hypothetical protein